MTGISKQFQLNEKVGFLHEQGWAIVLEISGTRVKVRDADGFDRIVDSAELIKIHGEHFHVKADDIQQIVQKDVNPNGLKKQVKTGSKKPIETWTIDLHIEALLESHAGMSNGEILATQMKELRMFFDRARHKHIRQLIVIHGVGEGVMKEEVRYFFQKQDGVTFRDADYLTFGRGATFVEINYNLNQS